MLKKLRTLRARILAIAALCWLLPTLVLGVYMSSVFFRALRAKAEQALIAGATHAQELAVQEIDRVLKKSRDVTYDGLITDYASDYLSGGIRYEEFYSLSRAYWLKLFQREQVVRLATFFLLNTPERLIYTAEDIECLDTYTLLAHAQVQALGETLDTRCAFIRQGDRLYHVRNLLDRKLQRYGMLVLELDPARLLAPFLGEDTLWAGQADIVLDAYSFTADSRFPFDAGAFAEGLSTRRGDLYYESRVRTADYTLTYRLRLDEAGISGEASTYYELIAVLILLLLPIEALIMLFIHQTVSRPMIRLSKATERMATGELGVTVPTSGAEEISRLGAAFNTMSLRIENLIDTSYREALALRDARISALQSRVNPHFLNNALELINWQARMDGADTVSQMIEALSTLLNASLDRTNERTVPLASEINVADAYFFFIRQRFGERVRIQKRIDPALLSAQIPRLAIQTLLENAVEHGISPAGGGTIRLDVYRQDAWLRIDVSNDGQPLSMDAVETIARLLAETGREIPAGHLGIRNVNLRLRLIYQDRAGLTLTREDSGETLARIAIPYAETLSETEAVS